MRADDLTLDDPDFTEAWLRCFAATARSKKLKDDPTKSEYPITDLFLSKAGVEAVHRVSIMVHPQCLEDMQFADIRKSIMDSVRPQKRLFIAKRVYFLSLKQDEKESVQSFLERLKHAAKSYEFEKLGRE